MREDRAGQQARSVVARVVELLPRATYRLETEQHRQVLAHAAPATRRNFVRLRPGDRVRVELSPWDPSRGRIIELLDPDGAPV
ncbi:MAG: translation initiation factor IF-1 [Bryobacterales bacterium]|nr:translation initiation factor IF-1 [Bryobacterales bacterium]